MSFFRPTSELQHWDAAQYHSHARFVAHLASDALDLLAVQPGERVLDIGCGDGYLSERLCRAGAELVGFDYSPEMVDAARARGLDVRLGNAERLYFHREFDAVFSNAALEWMRLADRVTLGTFEALKPGGRFVGEFAGAGNVASIREAVNQALLRRGINPDDIDPWYLPTAGEYQHLLENAGFELTYICWYQRPVLIDYPISEWLETFASPYLTALPAETRAGFLAEVTEDLAARLQGPDGRWTVDYTLLRFRAVKPLQPAGHRGDYP
jgi:trans-aconitate methyltransferase